MGIAYISKAGIGYKVKPNNKEQQRTTKNSKKFLMILNTGVMIICRLDLWQLLLVMDIVANMIIIFSSIS